MRFRTSYRSALVAAALVASSLGAQAVPVGTLGRLQVEFPESFSEVRAVRELRDGRVIVVDGRELTVQVVDFRSGATTRIGRTGEGPGEYRLPTQLFALPGDSTVLRDAAGGRLLIITPDAKPGDFLRLDPEVLSTATARAGRFFLRFADARGRLYSEAQPTRVGPDGVLHLTDSAAIERLDRATGRRDTVATWPMRKDAGAKLIDGSVFTQPNTRPFPTFDHWLVAPDGRIAFVFYDPYRVDYVSQNRAVTHGKPIPYDRIRVDEPLKQEFRAERQRPRMGMSVSRVGGSATIGPIRMPFQEPTEWPEFLPPFGTSSSLFAQDGKLWIKRTTAAGAPPTYDVIDGSGSVASRLVLPARTRVVGFGTGTVYLLRMDDDDLQYLQRYRLP